MPLLNWVNFIYWLQALRAGNFSLCLFLQRNLTWSDLLWCFIITFSFPFFSPPLQGALCVTTRYAICIFIGVSAAEDEPKSEVCLTEENSAESPLIQPALHFLWLYRIEALRVASTGLSRWNKLLSMAFMGPGMDLTPSTWCTCSLTHCKFMGWRRKRMWAEVQHGRWYTRVGG